MHLMSPIAPTPLSLVLLEYSCKVGLQTEVIKTLKMTDGCLTLRPTADRDIGNSWETFHPELLLQCRALFMMFPLQERKPIVRFSLEVRRAYIILSWLLLLENPVRHQPVILSPPLSEILGFTTFQPEVG